VALASQVRYEERFNLGTPRASMSNALLETDETLNYVPAAFAASLEKSRPAFESRVASGGSGTTAAS